MALSKATTAAFQDAIRRTHGCEATYLESVLASDSHEGKTVWTRLVHVFRLKDHPKAERCYVWTELVDDVSGKQRFYAVLDVPPVDSPEAAVRMSILSDYKQQDAPKDE